MRASRFVRATARCTMLNMNSKANREGIMLLHTIVNGVGICTYLEIKAAPFRKKRGYRTEIENGPCKMIADWEPDSLNACCTHWKYVVLLATAHALVPSFLYAHERLGRGIIKAVPE